MNRSRIALGIIILLVVIYFFTGGRAPASHDLFGGIDAWFRNVSGISISQVLFAIWRLFLWLVRSILRVIVALFQGGLDLVKG